MITQAENVSERKSARVSGGAWLLVLHQVLITVYSIINTRFTTAQVDRNNYPIFQMRELSQREVRGYAIYNCVGPMWMLKYLLVDSSSVDD